MTAWCCKMRTSQQMLSLAIYQKAESERAIIQATVLRDQIAVALIEEQCVK